MKWQDVCEHPDLQNLPFKIELDGQGRIIMSPVKVYHSAFQGKISSLLYNLAGDYVLTECAIATRLGTKVADVAWASKETFKQIINEVECSVAPEICIEVLSSTNTAGEIHQKKALYLEQGCKEIWVCSKEGKVTFHTADGEINRSRLVPAFPERVELAAR